MSEIALKADSATTEIAGSSRRIGLAQLDDVLFVLISIDNG